MGSQFMETRAERIYGSTYEELQVTFQRQLDAHQQLHQRAIDLAKVDLISISLIVSGVSLVELALPATYTVAGIVAFAYAIWCCLQSCRPRPYSRGVSGNVARELQGAVDAGIGVDDHFVGLMKAYQNAIATAEKRIEKERGHFRNGLWASIATAGYFGVATASSVLPSYPLVFDLATIGMITIAAKWGKHMYIGSDDST